MGEKELTIDDFFKFAESMSKKINEFGTQKGIEEKFAKAMINATDPDSRFKADIAMKLSTAMGMIDMLVTYVNKPVRVEGLLQRKLDGSVMLDSTPIPAGSLVEFWKHDKWNIGRVVQDPKTKQNQIIDPVSNKVVIDKIEQIKARIR
jgi:hypothetical protein